MDESGWRTDERTDSIRCVTRFGTSGRSFPCPCTCNLSRLLVFNLVSFLQFIRNYIYEYPTNKFPSYSHINYETFLFLDYSDKKKTLEKIFFFFWKYGMWKGNFLSRIFNSIRRKIFRKIFFFLNYFLNFFLYRIYLIDFQNNKFFINDA